MKHLQLWHVVKSRAYEFFHIIFEWVSWKLHNLGYINDEDEMIVPQSEHCVKVSKSRKQILKFSFEPKRKRKSFCISDLASKKP